MQNDVTTVGFPLLKAVTGTGSSTEFHNVMTDATPVGRMKSSFTAGVSTTGTPTAVNVTVEGSINGADWVSLGSHNLSLAELDTGYAMFPVQGIHVAYIRGNLNVLVDGTNPSVTMFVAVGEDGSTSSLPAITYGDSPALDGFGRLRVSNPLALWDNKNIHTRNKTLWEEPIDGAIIVYENLAGGPFVVTETITGGTSDSVGIVTAVDGGALTITYTVNHNDFTVGEQITGGTSGATADIVSADTGSHITHSRDEATVTLQVGASSGDSCTRHTHRFFSYVSGKSQRIDITFIFGVAVTNVRRRAGYFFDSNGLFFEQDSSGLRFVRRTNTSGSVVDNKIEQADWNLDTLDGNGASSVTLDPSKIQLLTIDFQWLGAGRVRFGFDVGGHICYVHEIVTSNNLTLPFMSTPSLPVRYEIQNTGATAGTNTMKEVCSSVVSEGGEALSGIGFAKSNDVTGVTITTGSLQPILLIRLKNTFGTGSGPNRKTVQLTGFGAFVTDNTVHIEVAHIHDPTSINGSWVSRGDDSAVEYNVTATTIAGGSSHVVDEDYIPAGQAGKGSPFTEKTIDKDNQHNLITQDTTSTNSEVFALVGERLAGGSDASAFGHMRWIESD